jgi:hypothetical protein
MTRALRSAWREHLLPSNSDPSRLALVATNLVTMQCAWGSWVGTRRENADYW